MVQQLKSTLSLFLTLSVLGCVSTTDYRGKPADNKELQKIRPHKSTKEDILQILGSPTTVSAFNNNRWHYIHKITETTAFFKPTVIDQEVVTLTFNAKDVLVKVTHRGVKDAQEIDYTDQITPTYGQSGSVLRQIFGNFGRFARKNPNTHS